MKKEGPTPISPWVSRKELKVVIDRCVEAEDCLKRLLTMIDPDVLERNMYDWKAATAEILQGS